MPIEIRALVVRPRVNPGDEQPPALPAQGSREAPQTDNVIQTSVQAGPRALDDRREPCNACGSDELMAQIEQHLGVKAHETRADGAVSLEPVYCLGLCAQSPAIQVNDRLFARVTTERLPALLAGVETA